MELKHRIEGNEELQWEEEGGSDFFHIQSPLPHLTCWGIYGNNDKISDLKRVP